ncbi:helix-turn-helix domain-containing protein [Niveispirillum sp.]|uniref:helix-turn-helix domain-containing protein n=1 Tax=Niveispirillum sp. TaxID=1917217 RepID=UPI001B58F255|nr:helix-turn-helix domain-containing protein [Niveispirillum sp.]MBP7339530.1 helix-turn-helix domain-containing protein [Niveispirillum sp.]
MTDPGIPVLSILPGTHSSEDLFWAWRQSVQPYFDSVPLSNPRDPSCPPEVRLYNLNDFLFFDTKFARQKFIRDVKWNRRNDDVEHILLNYYVSGTNQVENGSNQYAARYGGTYLLNMQHEIDALASDCRVLSLILPRQLVREHMPLLQANDGEVFSPGSMASRLFGDFMVSLVDSLPTARPTDGPLVMNALFGLVNALLANADPASQDSRQGVFQSLQRYIDSHLGDSTLGVGSLCAHFRMSRATLYRLFADKGGVRDYIQRRRLMAAFKALSAPANHARGIFDVAMDYGFTSASHFTSSFRAEFKMTPSELRETSHAHGQGRLISETNDDLLADEERIAHWIREFRG